MMKTSFQKPTSNLFATIKMFEYNYNRSTFLVQCFIFSRGYARRRNYYCCGSEYANLSLTQMQTKSIIQIETN